MTDCLDRLPAALAAVAPTADPAVWTDALTAPMRSTGLFTPRRAAAFLGQVAEESGGFTRLSEDLNYSARRLCEVWPARFPDMIAAAPYSQNPERLANRVYANRLGNGDESSGDGWRFRGAGLIQITGRQLYSELAAATVHDLDSLADWMQTPAGAAMSACWYWNLRHLNPIADGWDIQRITLLINGGLTNLPTRIALSTAALAAFGAPIFHDAPEAVADAENSADELNAEQLGEHT